MTDEGRNVQPTYLSERVYRTVVTLQKTTLNKTHDCLTQDFFFDWAQVDITLGKISEYDNILDYPQVWFCEKNELLWSILNSVGEKVIDSLEEGKLDLSHLSFWFDDNNESELILKKFFSFHDNELLLCLLILTSRIERVLGNVYSACGKDVPFLLKDLLGSDVLRNELGKIQVIFLQLLLGCVQGLNLRNIAWHGFFSPMELHRNVIATLIITLISLSHQLKHLTFPIRPYIQSEVTEKHAQLLKPFYSSVVLDECLFMKAVVSCTHISKSHRSYWKFAFDLLQAGSFGHSLIFLLPLIENLLRSVFCLINGCPARMLTAESTAFYTTLDDILSPSALSGENKMKDLIGTKLFEMLLDLFVYQEGPRLRDRISHAEMNAGDIPDSIAQHVFGMTTSLLMIISEREDKLTDLHHSFFLKILEIPEKYVTLYHPVALLKISLINELKNVRMWIKIPLPTEIVSHSNDEDCVSLQTSLSEITGYDFTDSSNILAILTDELSLLSPPTLFRPKYELELISLLRRIVENIEELNQNISLNFQLKYELWLKKTMKSRVRDNYKRMATYLPLVQHTIACLFFFMSVILNTLHQLDENKSKYILRFFKQWLQYVENSVSMSNIKKNRWNELRSSSIIICTQSAEKYNLIKPK